MPQPLLLRPVPSARPASPAPQPMHAYLGWRLREGAAAGAPAARCGWLPLAARWAAPAAAQEAKAALGPAGTCGPPAMAACWGAAPAGVPPAEEGAGLDPQPAGEPQAGCPTMVPPPLAAEPAPAGLGVKPIMPSAMPARPGV